MWFGTANGLCRFDGRVLKTFKYSASNELDVVNNFVKGKMLEDKTGNIWYCNGSGIYKWDVFKELVVRVGAFDKKEYNATDFSSIYLDDQDGLWMYNLTHGIVVFNIINNKLIQYPFTCKIDYSTVFLNYVTVDNNENIWLRIGNKRSPYLFFNRQSKKYSVQLGLNPPHALFFEKKRRILAHDDRLIFENEQSGKTTTILKSIKNKKVSFHSLDGINDNFGRLWLTARAKGLFCYDESKNQFFEFHHDNAKLKSLPFDLTTCLFIDRNENLWIGIDGAGVAKLDLKQPKFNLFPLSDGDFPFLNDYYTKCFFEDSIGRIWFGSHTGGLNIFDPNLQILVNYHHKNDDSKSLPGNIVGNILKDKEGNMWIGSSGGISLFNQTKKSFETISIQGLPKLYPLINNFVFKMLQLKDGSFLAATFMGIIKVFKENNGKYKGYYFSNNGPLTSLTTDVAEMPDKIVYATVPGLGLYQLKPDAERYKLVNIFLNGTDLRSVKRDEKDSNFLWIGSGKGLIHFNTVSKAYRKWDENDGLANSYVYGGLQDALGNLWVSTNKGLSFFNRKENKFDNYSFQDGLQSNEFNTQSFYKSSTGTFYFGGIKGFNWFKPGYVSKELIKPLAAITSIEISDVEFQKDSSYLLHQTITVPYYKNDFNFQFAALDFTRPEANNIRYMLQGWDAGWIAADNRSARYGNLPPGSYTLKLKVANADGIWSNEEKINIVIQAPFWKTNWFMAAVTLLLLGVIIYITFSVSQQKAKRKLRLLENQIAVDAERNRISADMHDEIGSGITHIALLSELIQTQQKVTPDLKKDINIIATSARKLVQTMSEIIWALNPQNDTLENLVAYIREQSYQYFESFEMQFTIDFPDEVPAIKLSNAERRNLYLVTREALNNAMKHAEASAIQLTLECTKINCSFYVTDNGKGMNLAKIKAGSNGLINMKKRMQDIGGTIEWMPVEKGTQVKYSFTF